MEKKSIRDCKERNSVSRRRSQLLIISIQVAQAEAGSRGMLLFAGYRMARIQPATMNTKGGKQKMFPCRFIPKLSFARRKLSTSVESNLYKIHKNIVGILSKVVFLMPIRTTHESSGSLGFGCRTIARGRFSIRKKSGILAVHLGENFIHLFGSTGGQGHLASVCSFEGHCAF